VGKDFSHYRDALGLEDARTGCWGSPFDYAARARLYVPRGLPDPGTPEHTKAVVEKALPLIRAAGGSTFLLFTTLRAMRLARELLAGLLQGKDGALPLLVQGEAPRSELLERFRRLGNAVLVASASFWEGVDVRGEALRLVVIDKLPFAPPDDPVMEERLKAIARAGRNAFMEYQLPQAAITLKQGAGRLIRDEHDHGVLMICDPRLVAKSYGRRLIASLPPMLFTRDAEETAAFLLSFGTPSE
jgi:ATP-dependent DNA helicase DinG